MSARKLRIVLNEKASRDIQGIQEYTIERWGPAQAQAYDEALLQALEMLQSHPHLGILRQDVMPGLHSHPVGTHTILYRVEGDALIVYRVLHQRADLGRNRLK